MPRDRWLETLPDYIVHEYAAEEQIVDVDGDVAVVLHRDRMRATVLGIDRSGTFVITDVWRRRDGDWRIWRRHSTPLTLAHCPVVSDRFALARRIVESWPARARELAPHGGSIGRQSA